jgi:cytochrome P450
VSIVASESLSDQLDRWFTADPGMLGQLPELWEELRESAPVCRHGAVTVVTPYQLVDEVVHDDARFSNDYGRRGSRASEVLRKLETPEEQRAFHEVMAFESRFMLRNDGPEHRRRRDSVSAAMTPKRIQTILDAITAHADAAITQLPSSGVVDLVPFSYEVPLRTICDLIGVPPEDRTQVMSWGGALSRNRHGTDVAALLEAHRVWIDFHAYVIEMIAHYDKSADGSDQLVTRLMSAHGDRLETEDVASLMVMLLLGGHESTSNLIATGLYELLRAPDQWRLLVNDPSLIPNAVEEMLRMVTPAQTATRLSIAQVKLAGTEIPADTTVIAVLASANRDPLVFPHPDRLDVRRADAKRHLAFSRGPHFCLGSSLARAEATTVLQKLTTRFPRLSLASEGSRFRGPWSMRRLVELPVSVS